MPKNKDLKRLVRSRMEKTGEAYTTARRHVTAKRATDAKLTAPSPDLEALAGMRDASVVAKTGRSWAQWVELLDREGARDMNHTEIAALVNERHAIAGWWSQTVAVGYERIRGKRAKNQVASGYSVSKSKTLAVPVARLVKALAPRARETWLGATGKARRSSNPHVVRWQDDDGAFVDVNLLPKGEAKTTVNVQLTRLQSAAEVENARALWAERLDALAAWLAHTRR